ncbi:hypothetical protein [Clostridium sp.]|uniref:hypothetical protein n=1 Tax=Clostridium TaxID=1485 RepID=UPI0029007564|nr:hypothetical protein [Clostridium sp.]MDU1825430.1 hypothetical protein [Clostridium sp.]MDU1843352.1 hypothetical protein [Clostridium sp.]MDU2692201.1 hypothetical protein [Clostridium sp.]MDU2958451.1 hypothetical protein [Clostridium sp.]MDU3109232.1 hypothetical protein [Clostridium sp.]
MAQRRMFSIKIIDSAKFLKMPMSARLLYYDLGMRADDDGVVEAYNVLKMTGSTEDDLRVLLAKEYVKVLNDDMVTFICHWSEHNKIRADRKIDSIYKDLLLQVLPSVKLLEPKERADLKKRNSINDEWTSIGRPMDGIGKDRLGKDKLGKDRLDEYKVSNEVIDEIKIKWNGLGINKLVNISDKRYRKLQIILSENNIDTVFEAIEKIKSSSYLKGMNPNGWIITFDWFIELDNFYKILEDTYKDRIDGKKQSFNNFVSRSYDYEHLEKQLLGWE